MNKAFRDDFTAFSDNQADTRPSQRMSQDFLQQEASKQLPSNLAKKKARVKIPGGRLWYFLILIGLITAGYLFFPGRTNILVLGVDDRAAGGNLGRTDTMILVTVVPMQRFAGMLSIPRDLWVPIPGYGENRINTAHFFAEADTPGSGAETTVNLVEGLFGIDVDYYFRLRFDSLAEVVDDFGGIEITFDEPTSGYPEGTHVLTGEQALAFVRDRENSDDFGRMQRGQMFIKAAMRELVRPGSLFKLVAIAPKIMGLLDTNAPIWLWLRIGFPLLFPGSGEIYSQTINREMVNPFTTSDGAQVLAPNWGAINQVVYSIFYAIPEGKPE